MSDALKSTKTGLFVDTIQRAMCEAFALPVASECRLWMKSSDSSCERLRNMHMSVLDACLSTGMVRTPLSLLCLALTHRKQELPTCLCLCVFVCTLDGNHGNKECRWNVAQLQTSDHVRTHHRVLHLFLVLLYGNAFYLSPTSSHLRLLTF